MPSVLYECERVWYEYIVSISGNIANGSGGELGDGTVPLAGPLGDTTFVRFSTAYGLTVARQAVPEEIPAPYIVIRCPDADDDIETGNSTIQTSIEFLYPAHVSSTEPTPNTKAQDIIEGLIQNIFRHDLREQLNKYQGHRIGCLGITGRKQHQGLDGDMAGFQIMITGLYCNIGISAEVAV